MTWLFRILERMSPELVKAFKEGLKELMQKMYEQALKTESGWDDWGVRMMAQVFDVELTEPDNRLK